MEKDDKQKTSVSAAPTFGSDRSGSLNGAGAEVSVGNSRINSSAGFFHTPSSTTVYGGIEKSLSDSSSIRFGGSKNSRGPWSVSAGFERRW